MRICVSCLIPLHELATTGECTLYRSSDYHVLCEPCFLDEDEVLFELAGTNDIPELLELYDAAQHRKRTGQAGALPSVLWARMQKKQ